MAEILDAEEEQRLDSYLLHDVNYWLGATDAASEGTWRWQETHQNVDYSNWYPGQPNNRDYEDCLIKVYSELFRYNGKWHDIDCNRDIFHLNNHALCQTSK